MSALRWGILATGGIAATMTADLRQSGFDIRAVGSRSQGSADAFAERFDIPRAHGSYEALAADPDVDAVYVATPHPMHVAPAELLLQHGKHVLVEKPFTINAAQAARLRDVAAANDRVVLEAMWTRYLPHMARIRALIADGAIGEPRSLVADHTQSITDDPTHRLNALELGGGALLDLGIYPISLAWDVFGEPASITASATLRDTGADHSVAVTFGYASGAMATTYSSARARGSNTAVIAGTTGRIEIDTVWYTATGFRLVRPDGEVVLTERPVVEGRGMQCQALALEAAAAGDTDAVQLSIDESVAIMGSLDAIREQIGVRYPGE